jgi:hypothetical protein
MSLSGLVEIPRLQAKKRLCMSLCDVIGWVTRSRAYLGGCGVIVLGGGDLVVMGSLCINLQLANHFR